MPPSDIQCNMPGGRHTFRHTDIPQHLSINMVARASRNVMLARASRHHVHRRRKHSRERLSPTHAYRNLRMHMKACVHAAFTARASSSAALGGRGECSMEGALAPRDEGHFAPCPVVPGGRIEARERLDNAQATNALAVSLRTRSSIKGAAEVSSVLSPSCRLRS